MEKPVIIADPEALARVMKAQRKALRATQETVAEMHDMSRFTIVDAESGKGDPKLSTILTLLNGLGLSLVAMPTRMAHQIEMTGFGEDLKDPEEPSGQDMDEPLDGWDFDVDMN